MAFVKERGCVCRMASGLLLFNRRQAMMISTEFVCWNDKAEVSGETILAMLGAMDKHREEGMAYLRENGIDNPSAGEWYPLERYINTFRTICERLGPYALYMIGSMLPSRAAFPAEVTTIEDALLYLNSFYKANHRGSTGYFKYTSLDTNAGLVECKKTYGTTFDKGLLAGLGKRFKPGSSARVSVQLDMSKNTRDRGGDSNTFIVKW